MQTLKGNIKELLHKTSNVTNRRETYTNKENKRMMKINTENNTLSKNNKSINKKKNQIQTFTIKRK